MTNATGKPVSTPAAELASRFRTDLKRAMQARDREQVDLLRVLIAAIDNAGAVTADVKMQRSLQARFGDGSSEITRREPDAAELTQLLVSEITARRDAVQAYIEGGHIAEAEKLEREVDMIARYLAPAD